MKAILKKLHAIQSEVGMMSKDGTNAFQHYNYLSETQVTLKMKELLDKHSVIFTHSSEITSVQASASEKQTLTNIKVGYKFYDVDSGEVLEGSVAGQGCDTGDKGVYKAITGAIKYIFMKNFLIPTGDDPEKDMPIKKQTQVRKEPVKQEAPKTAITVKQATLKKEGELFNLLCIVNDTKERQTSKNHKDVTDFYVHDSGNLTKIIVTMWGKTPEGLKQDDTVIFKDVKIGTYLNKLTYLAKGIEKVNE